MPLSVFYKAPISRAYISSLQPLAYVSCRVLTRPIIGNEAMFSMEQQHVSTPQILRYAGFTASELLDPVHKSVKSVSEGLKSGTIPAPHGYVVMFAEKEQKHILLYSKAAQTTAFLHFGLHCSEGESDDDLATSLGFLDVSQEKGARSSSRSRSRSRPRSSSRTQNKKKKRVRKSAFGFQMTSGSQ